MPRPIRRNRTRSERKRSREETERIILKAAQELFAAKGFFGTTVDQIVAKAGVSRGAFYLYFKNREDIYAKLLSRVVGEMFVLSAAHQTGTPAERVEAGNRAFLETFSRYREFMRSVAQVVTFDPAIAEVLNQLRGQFVERVRRHLEKCVAKGRCHPLDPSVASFALVLMVEFFAYAWLSFGWQPQGVRFDLDAVVTELSRLWCRAVYRDEQQLQAPPRADGPLAPPEGRG